MDKCAESNDNQMLEQYDRIKVLLRTAAPIKGGAGRVIIISSEFVQPHQGLHSRWYHI